jgi:hypothetical protein
MNWLKKAAILISTDVTDIPTCSAQRKLMALTFGFSCALMLISCPVFAWSKVGHWRMTDAAFMALEPKQRQYFSQLAESLPRKPSYDLPPLSASSSYRFAYLGVWPDLIRNHNLLDLFKRVGENVPEGIKQHQKQNTSRWHYHNAFVYQFTAEAKGGVANDAQIAQCQQKGLRNTGLLLSRMRAVDKALNEPLSAKQAAILLALQIHLIQDATQPLHTFARVDASCRHDRGGKSLCLDKGPNKRCSLNLHQLWDGGFGQFDSPTFASNLLERSVYEQKENTFNPEQWLIESRAFAAEVYAMEKSITVDGVYRIAAQKIARDQIIQSHQRLVWYLIDYYQTKTGVADIRH